MAYPVSIDLERERTVQALCAHYAQDQLTTQELERRFEQVYRASTVDELRTLTLGLPVLSPAVTADAPPPLYTVAARTAAPQEKRYLAIMAEVRRQGRWITPSRVKASAFMGSVRLDLREAEIPAGGVDIDASAILGEIRIILPPGLHADVDGFVVMGQFFNRTAGTAPSVDLPVVRVRGSAVMGSVYVETRLPDEGVLETWRRRLRGTARSGDAS